MPKLMKSLPANLLVENRGRKPMFPSKTIDEFFDGRVRRFWQGEDFSSKPSSFACTVRRWAKARNKAVDVRVDKNRVYVQAI